jgi:hypothetical protein
MSSVRNQLPPRKEVRPITLWLPQPFGMRIWRRPAGENFNPLYAAMTRPILTMKISSIQGGVLRYSGLWCRGYRRFGRPCCLHIQVKIFVPENGDSTFFRNVDIHRQHHTWKIRCPYCMNFHNTKFVLTVYVLCQFEYIADIFLFLLFIIHINSLPLRTNSVSEPVLFAEYTTVIILSINFEDFCSVSNIVLSRMIKCLLLII